MPCCACALGENYQPERHLGGAYYFSCGYASAQAPRFLCNNGLEQAPGVFYLPPDVALQQWRVAFLMGASAMNSENRAEKDVLEQNFRAIDKKMAEQIQAYESKITPADTATLYKTVLKLGKL